jgi:hypothetical protein
MCDRPFWKRMGYFKHATSYGLGFYLSRERARMLLMSEVPGFDGHLENDHRFTDLQPATDIALATTTRSV